MLYGKYKRQARIPSSRWITIPLACAATSFEALRMESWWIKKIKPSLNIELPFWMRRASEDRRDQAQKRCQRPNPRHLRIRKPIENPNTSTQ